VHECNAITRWLCIYEKPSNDLIILNERREHANASRCREFKVDPLPTMARDFVWSDRSWRAILEIRNEVSFRPHAALRRSRPLKFPTDQTLIQRGETDYPNIRRVFVRTRVARERSKGSHRGGIRRPSNFLRGISLRRGNAAQSRILETFIRRRSRRRPACIAAREQRDDAERRRAYNRETYETQSFGKLQAVFPAVTYESVRQQREW